MSQRDTWRSTVLFVTLAALALNIMTALSFVFQIAPTGFCNQFSML